jgi:hypothetical protein
VCAEVEPELRVIDSTRLVACHFAEQTDARVTEDFSRSTTPKE